MVSSSSDFDPYENNWSTQKFIQIGWPILAVFDIHMSYHQIAGSLKVKDETKYDNLEELTIDGDMYAIGVAVGF